MQTIEEYISLRKRKDKIDEFDFEHHSENMGKIIKYVSDYFNEYLTVEDYSYEQTKLQQNINKAKKNLVRKYPQTHEFIEQYYLDNQKRLDFVLGKSYESFVDVDLFYRDEDFRKIAEDTLLNRLEIINPNEKLLVTVTKMAREHHIYSSSKPTRSEMKELDNAIVRWVFDMYKEYKVNLSSFAFMHAWKWEDKYVERIYDRQREEFYFLNKYDYKYQDAPFDVDNLYEKYGELPFLKDRKDYLEMLIMYHWLFDCIEETDYWAEYVQLCATNRHIELKNEKRILIPVSVPKVSYPMEIDEQILYVETKNGLIRKKDKNRYILALNYEKGNDDFWRDNAIRKQFLERLSVTIEEFGVPEMLEFQSPYSSPNFGIKEFLDVYCELEKTLKPYKKMILAVRSVSTTHSRGKTPLISTMNDIMMLNNASRDLKLRLKLMVDLVDTNRRNVLKKDMSDMINSLTVIPNFFIGMHINGVDSWGHSSNVYNNHSRGHVFNRDSYAGFSEFMSGITTILQDSTPRYLVPEKINTEIALEKLVDTFYRCGCKFERGETNE